MERPEENPLFIAQTGPLEGQRWVVRESLLIGRDPDCDVIVLTPDKQVSRHHARVLLSSEGILIEDLGSKNGTHINNRRIEGPVMLQDGDTIQIALAQQFVFLSSDATVPLELGAAAPPLATGLLRLDKRARRVWVGNREVTPPLSVAQFTMLELLYAAAGRVVSRQELIEAVWGGEQSYDVSNQALDALVRRLRDRLAEVDSEQEFVVTVRGHGLRLENPA